MKFAGIILAVVILFAGGVRHYSTRRDVISQTQQSVKGESESLERALAQLNPSAPSTSDEPQARIAQIETRGNDRLMKLNRF